MKFLWMPALFTCLSTAAAWAAALMLGHKLGGWQYGLWASGALGLLSIIWHRRGMTKAEKRFTKGRKIFLAERRRLTEKRKQLRQEQAAFEKYIKQQRLALQKKETEVLQKLTAAQEWTEMQPLLSEDDSEGIPAGDIREKDLLVAERLREQAEHLFSRAKKNAYYQDGRIRWALLGQEMTEMIESVAQIYHPDSKAPLMETSIEQLLRSASRIALQSLMLLEQLPIDIRTYSVRNIHDAVQKGIKAYDFYKAANPYWNILRPVYYLGRVTLGGNPVTLGAGWAVGEIVKGSAKKLSSHMADRYVVHLLHDMVFIIGGEAAGVFGGDFRHREPHWIYGAELTELVCRLPASHSLLQQSLKETGSLFLRSEYDRIFLYRCLAARKSANPDQYQAARFLSSEMRQELMARLDKFAGRHKKGHEKIIASWRKKTVKRLEISSEKS